MCIGQPVLHIRAAILLKLDPVPAITLGKIQTLVRKFDQVLTGFHAVACRCNADGDGWSQNYIPEVDTHFADHAADTFRERSYLIIAGEWGNNTKLFTSRSCDDIVLAGKFLQPR